MVTVPLAMAPILLVPALFPLRIKPCQPFPTKSALASDAIARMLFSGAPPAWLALPQMSISPPIISCAWKGGKGLLKTITQTEANE